MPRIRIAVTVDGKSVVVNVSPSDSPLLLKVQLYELASGVLKEEHKHKHKNVDITGLSVPRPSQSN